MDKPSRVGYGCTGETSTRQIGEVLERIDLFYAGRSAPADIPDLILRRYARRLCLQAASAGAKIKEPAHRGGRMLSRYCLFTTTDQLILMVQRRSPICGVRLPMSLLPSIGPVYKTLLGELVALSAQGGARC